MFIYESSVSKEFNTDFNVIGCNINVYIGYFFRKIFLVSDTKVYLRKNVFLITGNILTVNLYSYTGSSFFRK